MEVSAFIALLLISLLSLVLFFSLSSGGRKTSASSHADGRRSLPPSPPGFPVLGHLPLLGSVLHRKLHAMSARHGPVILLRLGRVPAVVISSAAAAKEALKTHDLAVSSRPGGPMTERLMYGRYDMAFAPYGEHWRQARRFCVLHLLSQRRVLSFRPLREQEAAALVARVHRDAAAVNLSDALISYSNSVVLRAAFGDDNKIYGLDGGRKLRGVFAEFQGLMGAGTLGELVPWLSWVDTLRGLHAKATRTFETLDRLLERVVADHHQRRSGGRRVSDGGDASPRDFVDLLLDVNEAEEEAGGFRFDTVAIKGIILDMFVAGTDTTYTTLESAMAELINNPDKMRKLQEEIRAAVGDDDRVTEDHLHKLRYIKLVIKETLRLHPPASIVARETIQDIELFGYHVPVGTRVLVNAWAIGRDPATWERAEEFLPERFADEDATMDQYMVAQGFTSLPFGYGRRGCPGVGFSMPNVELVLASLLYHFDWALPAGDAMTVDMEERDGLAIRLKKALHVVAKPRSISERATF